MKDTDNTKGRWTFQGIHDLLGRRFAESKPRFADQVELVDKTLEVLARVGWGDLPVEAKHDADAAAFGRELDQQHAA